MSVTAKLFSCVCVRETRLARSREGGADTPAASSRVLKVKSFCNKTHDNTTRKYCPDS